MSINSKKKRKGTNKPSAWEVETRKRQCVRSGERMNLEAFVTHFGYLALVVGLMIEGETMLVFGAFMAHRGYLSLPLVILTGFLVTFASDQFFFWLGRTQGSRFLEGRPPRYNSTFDPYPYILLNLFLSMLASIQAPIIMMS